MLIKINWLLFLFKVKQEANLPMNFAIVSIYTKIKRLRIADKRRLDPHAAPQHVT